MTQRGDIVLVALPGDYGKPRPVVVVQADRFERLASVIVCPMTTDLRSDLEELRPLLLPTPENGLERPSQIMLDKPVTVPTGKVRRTVGHLDARTMEHTTQMLGALLAIL